MTENENPLSKGMDTLSAAGLLALMQREDARAVGALEAALPSLEQAVEDAVAAIRGGGRVYYAGAGTSGRLGVLDASEIPPTFGQTSFRAIIAGGARALREAVEGAEDDREAGAGAAASLTGRDMAVGISASGRTPFVLAFLMAAGEKGARCWLITCSETKGHAFLDGRIKLITGPEIVAGSTRLKAGTATKLALNMLSTATMVRLGGVYDGLMVDVAPSNKKLIARAKGIIREITGCPEEEAAEYLRLAGMRPKAAVVMLRKKVSKEEALRLLAGAGGSLRRVLEGE